MRRLIALLLAGLLCGCGEVAAHGGEEAFAPADLAAPAMATAEAVRGRPQQASPPPTPFAAPNAPRDEAEATNATRRAPQSRVVIYSAGLRVVVVSVSESLSAVRRIADTSGGYMQEISGDSITVRVPAEKFEATVAAIEKLGEVTDRAIKASDITEQMIDVKIRLENAEAARKRLLELLDKMQKTEDLLKAQQELTRVTADIESMKGKIRYLESQAVMSTIRVDFNSPLPRVARATSNLPFDWVQRLGSGLVAAALEDQPRKPGIFGHGPDFTPPPGFVRYYQSADYVEAMDAGDLRIKVQRQRNFDEADAKFWTQLAHKVLVEARSLAIADESVSGDVGRIAGSRDVAGKPYEYLLMIRRDRKNVVTIEAWGPKDQFAAKRDAIYAMADDAAKRK